MNNQVLFKFIEEVRLQCRQARLAYDNVRASTQGLDPEKTFFFVQAFLHTARNLSRFFWPERSSSNARGERLRQELKVGIDSPLNLGKIRRCLDAADEHFEDWVTALEAPNYMDFNIMPQGTMQGYQQDSFQRNLDPDTYQLVFRGEPCDLRKVGDEVRRVESAAQQWLKTHNPW